jgi:hypothetical protein
MRNSKGLEETCDCDLSHINVIFIDKRFLCIKK